jgi:hypothetical protein
MSLASIAGRLDVGNWCCVPNLKKTLKSANSVNWRLHNMNKIIGHIATHIVYEGTVLVNIGSESGWNRGKDEHSSSGANGGGSWLREAVERSFGILCDRHTDQSIG